MSRESYGEASMIRQMQIARCLHSCEIQLRNAILKNVSSFFIEFLSDLSYNYLRGNIKCTKNQFSCLKKYRKLLKRLSANTYGNKKLYELSVKRKRRVLCKIKDSNFWDSFLFPLMI